MGGNMDDEKRDLEKPIPDDLEDILSTLQLMALHQIESFGWELRFVRRPPAQTPVPVVFNDDGSKIGVLEDDGRINLETDIKIRK